METDPDYAFVLSQDSVVEEHRVRQLEDGTRQVVVDKIRNIIKKQFMQEIAAKEQEVTLITDRLTEARQLLDRLRACVVASYYSSSFTKPLEKSKVPEQGAAQHPAIQNVLRKAVTSVLSKNVPPDQVTTKTEQTAKEVTESPTQCDISQFVQSCDVNEIEDEAKVDDFIATDEKRTSRVPNKKDTEPQENLGGRHRIKKRIIIGNVSKYIPPDKREGVDKSTHKWMIYVRGGADEPRIDHFVRKVWFFLHPSYRPNDLVEVTEAPFHLTRRGWGEFPIRVQLHFCDPRNRRVDIIHQLRLDRTYTGLQTLGAETVCDVELDRSTVGLRVENLLQVPVITGSIQPDEVMETDEKPENALEEASTEKQEKESSLAGQGMEMENNEQIAESSQAVDSARDLPDSTSGETTDEKSTDNQADQVEITSAKDDGGNISETEENKDEIGMDVDEEDDSGSPEPLSVTTDKRRRRRRGDSCTVHETDDENQSGLEKSLAKRLLCSDGDDLQQIVKTADTQTVAATAQHKSTDILPPIDELDQAKKESEVIDNLTNTDQTDDEVTQSKETVEDCEKGGEPDDQELVIPLTHDDHVESKDVHVSALDDQVVKMDDVTSAIVTSSGNTADEKVTDDSTEQHDTEVNAAQVASSSTDDMTDPISPSHKPEKNGQPSVKVLTPPSASFSLPSSPISLSKKCIILSPTTCANESLVSQPSLTARLRSFSADTGGVITSANMLGKKVVYLKKSNAQSVSATHLLSSGTVNKVSQPVVVVRPRSNSSTEIMTQKLPQGKGNVTILKPIASSQGQAHFQIPGNIPIVVGRKRSHSVTTTPPGGIIYNVIPEKQQKLDNPSSAKYGQSLTNVQNTTTKIAIPISSLVTPSQAPTTDATQTTSVMPPLASLGKMTLSVPPSKQQPTVSSTAPKEVYLRLGASGCTVIPSANVKTTRESSVKVVDPVASTKTSTQKSYMLKNTKQGLMVVSQTSPTRVTPAQPPISRDPDNSKDEIKKNVPEPTQIQQVKSLSQQQMLSLKALQTALLGAGVSLNRPMQIKIAKPGNTQQPAITSLKNQQQFVLTTVTNGQGKQQLALVSADRLKQAAQNKTVNVPTSTAKSICNTTRISADVQVKSEDIETNSLFSWAQNKTNQELPFYKIVGNKIMSRNLSDIMEAMPLAAKLVPLVQRGHKVTDLPFCAETEADFLDWNVGKQRAAERQRACLIHRILTYVRDNSTDLKEATIPSKMSIINWCLMRGYSVFTDEYEAYDEKEGKPSQTNLSEMDASITCHSELIKTLQEMPVAVAPIRDDDEEVDIISVTPPRPQLVKIKEEPMDVEEQMMEKSKFRFNPTDEIRAVEEIAKEVEVKFDDVSVTNDLDAPLCQVVLAKALELFAQDLCRESFASSLIRRDGGKRIQRVLPEIVETEDVGRAVIRHKSLAILGDKHLGVETVFNK